MVLKAGPAKVTAGNPDRRGRGGFFQKKSRCHLWSSHKRRSARGVLANRGHVLHPPEALCRVDLELLAEGLLATWPRAPRPATSLCQTATGYAKPPGCRATPGRSIQDVADV
jgi:hypothetical protein